MATCAKIVGAKLPDNSAEDSYDILPELLGTQGHTPVRKYMLQQTPGKPRICITSILKS